MAPPRACVALDADPAAGHQPQVAVSDDRFAGLSAPLTTSRVRPPCADVDGPHLDGLIGFDHEHVLTLLADLHGGGRHDDRVGIGRQRHVDVDELARPEPAVARSGTSPSP